jgi:hypothetical protein
VRALPPSSEVSFLTSCAVAMCRGSVARCIATASRCSEAITACTDAESRADAAAVGAARPSLRARRPEEVQWCRRALQWCRRAVQLCPPAFTRAVVAYRTTGVLCTRARALTLLSGSRWASPNAACNACLRRTCGVVGRYTSTVRSRTFPARDAVGPSFARGEPS